MPTEENCVRSAEIGEEIMNKQQLANKIWESANKMRSKIEANEYKDYILGFIFYKYLSDNEVRFLHLQGMSDEELADVAESDADTVRYIQENIGYFIGYSDLFSTWLKMGKDFDVSNVTDALSAFNRLMSPSHKNVFDGIFNTLETGLSKLGESSGARTKAISDLLHLIKDIPTDGKQDYDALGFIYEYLIGQFASNAGKKAGEFYTPHEVSLLMSEIVAEHLKDRQEIQIYDPTSGSGSLLINIGRSVAKHMSDADHIKYYAQELKQNTYNLTRMNLVMRGINPANILTRCGDTLENDWPYFEEGNFETTYNPLYVDAVVSNPPYSQNWDPTGKEMNPRFARFGLAPKTKADYAFLLYDLYHIKPDGIMTIVLPHGVLFRGGEEGEIRKNLIESNHIDAIIGLPANIFFGTGIPTVIMVLKQRRTNTGVLIIDASKGFEKVGKNNKLRVSDIRRIADTVMARRDVLKYARCVSRELIRGNDYNLNIPRYVDSSEGVESWDIYASMFGGIPKSEIDSLSAYWDALPGLRDALFAEKTPGYFEIRVPDAKAAIAAQADVQAFGARFKDAFANWGEHLTNELIIHAKSLELSKEEARLSGDVFARLESIPLIDPYEAYQLLDDGWNKVSGDLELIQTEGMESVRKVDPHMVLKKVGGKDEEVQDGWQGCILPFELVQEALLSPQRAALKREQERLAELAAVQDEVLDSLSEEEKDADELNEDRDAFVPAAVQKKAKLIIAARKKGESFAEDSYEAKIERAAQAMNDEKALKAKLKSDSEALHLLTKATIEGLNDAQVHDMLVRKWVQPLVAAVSQMPEKALHALETQVQAMADKYAVTFADVEADILETEASLSAMIDQLECGEYDKKGLREFQTLLKGEQNG